MILAISEFVTVFEIARDSNGVFTDACFRLLIGIGALIGGVLHEQPATGHTKGDIITVTGKQLEVNYFYATPAYRNTLAHGGALRSGVYARLCYYNGEILRVGHPQITLLSQPLPGAKHSAFSKNVGARSPINIPSTSQLF